jgi:hypothetical protein
MARALAALTGACLLLATAAGGARGGEAAVKAGDARAAFRAAFRLPPEEEQLALSRNWFRTVDLRREMSEDCPFLGQVESDEPRLASIPVGYPGHDDAPPSGFGGRSTGGTRTCSPCQPAKTSATSLSR